VGHQLTADHSVYCLGRSRYGVSYEVYVVQYDDQVRLARFYWHRD